MGRKKKSAKKEAKKTDVKKPDVEVSKTKPIDVKVNPEAKTSTPNVRRETVSPQDKERLARAVINHSVRCQQCPHKQSLDDSKALIISTYVRDGEENFHYDVKTGILTLTRGDKK